ncbi:MAG TPA: DUF6223 family protein [Acidimicrobiales bacterium]|nr:DUF6223 family protein [Acidimicrobiales bacterium]
MHTNDATFLQPVAASVLAVSAGRLGALVAATLALIGVVVGGLALARSAGRTRPDGGLAASVGRDGAKVATALGLIGIALGGVITATADDGIGTGNGLGGAIVAMLLGLVSVVLGGLARARSRRTA